MVEKLKIHLLRANCGILRGWTRLASRNMMELAKVGLIDVVNCSVGAYSTGKVKPFGGNYPRLLHTPNKQNKYQVATQHKTKQEDEGNKKKEEGRLKTEGYKD